MFCVVQRYSPLAILDPELDIQEFVLQTSAGRFATPLVVDVHEGLAELLGDLTQQRPPGVMQMVFRTMCFALSTLVLGLMVNEVQRAYSPPRDAESGEVWLPPLSRLDDSLL